MTNKKANTSDSETNKKIVKNTSIFAIGNAFSKLVQFIIVPLFTYVFTTEEFGITDLIISSSTVIIAVVSLCTVESVFRFTLEGDLNKKSVFSNSLLILFCSSFFLITVFLILKSFNIQFIENYGLATLGYIILLMFHEVIHYFIKGLEKVGMFVIDGVIYAVLSCCLSLLFVKVFGLGINGYLLGYCLSLLVCILFMFISCKLFNFFSFKSLDRKLLLKMIIYSSPIVLNNISWWIMNLSDKYTVLFMLGADANGILSIVHKVPTILTIIYTIFSQAFSISAIKDIGLENDEGAIKLSNVFNYLVSMNLVLTSTIIILIMPITKLIFEESFFDSWNYVPFMLIATIFYCMAAYLGLIYNIKKKNINFGLSTLVGGIVNFLICFALANVIGLYAASISTMIADMLIFIIRYFDIRRDVNIKIKPNVLLSLFLVFLEPFAYLLPVNYFCSLILISALSIISFVLISKDVIYIFRKIFSILNKKNSRLS